MTASWTTRCLIGTSPGLFPSGWTDVSTRLRGTAEIDYGRPDEFGSDQTGTCRVELDNRDRLWDPGIEPGTAIRVEAVLGAVTRPVFYGVIERAPAHWPTFGDAVVDVAASDALGFLIRVDIELTELEEQLTGSRVLALLNAAGWPTGLRDVGAGVVLMPAATSERGAMSVNILQALRDAVSVEQGMMWIGPDGRFVFRDRHSRLNQTTAATLSDATKNVAELHPSFDDLRLFTVGYAQMDDGETIEFTDDAAVARYGRRVFNIRDLKTSLVESEAVTAWMVIRYAYPQLRFEQVEMEGAASDASLTTALTLQPNDLVRVVHQPPGGGAPLDALVNVEAVHHRWVGASWRTTFELSPYFGAGPWFRLDESLLDSTAGLAP